MTETNGFCRSLLMGMMHERIIPMIDILPTHEVARELRCSKAHVSKAIAGKLPNVTPLPATPMSRRKLVRRSALMSEWKRMNAVPYIHCQETTP